MNTMIRNFMFTPHAHEGVRGFTLLEMLTVIAIIGILTSIVYPNLSGSRERARDSERITEVGEIALALELYYNACNREYPTLLTAGINNGCPTGVDINSFLTEIPTDPLNSGSHIYTYTYTVSSGTYVIKAVLERDNAALANDLDGTSCEDDTLNYCKGS